MATLLPTNLYGESGARFIGTGADQLIEGFSGKPEVLKLVSRDAFGERALDVRGNLPFSQLIHEPLDADRV